MLFDLDNTLLNRDMAVDKLFLMLVEKCYIDVDHSIKNDMRQKFKEYDKKDFGKNDKTKVLASLFDEFPPRYKMPRHAIQDFWNHHFPQCFSINQDTITIINSIKKQVKVGIITNGSVERQKAKIFHTNLDHCFDTIIISDEVGWRKPDKRIFEFALNRLHVNPEDTLFVGDDLEKDIGGCQQANIKGIWFNPSKSKNDTDIQPYAEIHSFELIKLLNIEE
ncbi:2-haloalkanoic acid dehalogenase [Lysinibacillus sp. ZYM-1]|nr:HAD family hydrolase [Lysinibacillus sp. ZYM-1]KPN97541.1 2-haloalkanoic acid dehalogenase [Lysinibacillus sp. ZYM-1]